MSIRFPSKLVRLTIIFFLIFTGHFSHAQSIAKDIQYNFETYMGFDLDNQNSAPAYVYNHHYLKSPRINYALVDWRKSVQNWNFQLGIHDGDYVRRNYSDQPTWAKLISSAQIQFTPRKLNSLKITAGIFPSHIGFETAWIQNNLTLTRSLLAENSPFYESGIHTQYTSKNNKLTLGLLALTGWQQAHLTTPAKKASWGWSSSYQLNPQILLSYNGFWGYQNATGFQPKSYHNFYSTLQQEDWKFIVGLDWEQINNPLQKQHWYSPVFIAARTFNAQWQVSCRIESLIDEYSLVLTDNTRSLQQESTFGFTTTYFSKSQFQWRLECKEILADVRSHGKDYNTLIVMSISKSGMLR
jgi:hypothetical protein